MSGDRPSLVSRVGDLLAGKYRLVQELGAGGMGAVYEAKHELIGRRFAVKFLHADLTKSEDMLARFRREAQTAGALENENIVAVTDFGFADDGAPYMVMEHLAGEDLRGIVTREGRLSVARAVFLIIQACRGLAAAHARGIIHRDLKPENLFVTKRGDGAELLKILDFGIAKLRGSVTSGASTKAGVMMGTLYYMPPEQIRGAKDIDHRADVYALGAILYELLSGQVPHPGEEVHVVIYHILHESIVPLASVRSDVPSGLAEVIEKALAHDVRERHADIDDLARELTPFAGRRMTPLESRRPGESLASAQTAIPLVETVTDSESAASSGTAKLSGPATHELSSKLSGASSQGVGNETQQALVAAGIRRSAMRSTRRWQGIGVGVAILVGVSAVGFWRASSARGVAPSAASAPAAAVEASPLVAPSSSAPAEAESEPTATRDASREEPEPSRQESKHVGRVAAGAATGKRPDAAAPAPAAAPIPAVNVVPKPGRAPPKFDRDNPYQ